MKTIIACLTLMTATPATGDDAVFPFTDACVLPFEGTRKRSIVRQDVIEPLLLSDEPYAPRPGDEVPVSADRTLRWEAVSFDDKNRVNHRALRNGYLAATVKSEGEQVVLFHGKGHSYAVINGRTLPGDPYRYGFVSIPVLLRPGSNTFVIRCSRGAFSGKLERPSSELAVLNADFTRPDVVRGEKGKLLASALVVNATRAWVTDAMLKMTTSHDQVHGQIDREKLNPIPPLTTLKVPFSFEMPVVKPDIKETNLTLQVLKSELPIGEPRTFSLRVRDPHQLRRRTFKSEIDGSVQYYTVRPRKADESDSAKPALVLTLHGAGVESQRQASCYKPKSWCDVVAPTNRRSFGFDWEDWGRIDAIEVLNLSSKRLGSDPLRTYLTGHSMGGHGTWQLGAHYPDRFAAIAPSAGWVSFRSYTSSHDAPDADPVVALLQRSSNASDTLGLSRNYAQQGIYVLHGDRDDNVPVSEARSMRSHLAKSHTNFAYYERPGAGHWWGDQCMDWPPLFDFLANNRRQSPEKTSHIDFTTVSPAISARHDWITIQGQQRSMERSHLSFDLDRKSLRFRGKTENASALTIDLAAALGDALKPDSRIKIEVDNTKLEHSGAELGNRLHLELRDDTWRPVDQVLLSSKGPHRAGPLKEAYRNQVLLVIGTSGSDAEDAWALAKARYDSETFWYRGNASFEMVRDTELDAAKTADRNVILYGNAETNSAWGKVLAPQCPIKVNRSGVTIGERHVSGESLCMLAIYPRQGSDTASVGIVAGTGLRGCRALDRLPIFVSGVGVPDWVVISDKMFKIGAQGILGTGFFDRNWKVDSTQSAWRKSSG